MGYPLDTPFDAAGRDSGFRIRVEMSLRVEFLEACHSQGRPAAQVLGEFMRGSVARHANRLSNMAIESPSTDGLDCL